MGTEIAMATRQGVDAIRLPNRDVGMEFISQLEERWRLATMLVRSGMIPQKSNEAAMAIMLKAHELGIAPMQGFANLYFFDGKMGISADLMTALFIQRAGGQLVVKEWTDKVCTIEFSREGWEPSLVSYTVEDAKEAGLLGKQNWKNKKAMLSARCRAMGIRLLAPEVFAGTYSREELSDMEPGDFKQSRQSAGAAALNAQIMGTADPIPEGEWEPGEDFPAVPTEEPADLATDRAVYSTMLTERGMGADKDRREFQKRIHADGLTASASVTAWTADDYAAAFKELDAIPPVEA